MDMRAVCEAIINRASPPEPAESEAVFRDAWRQNTTGNLSPIALSAAGGAAADRPSWVFYSGYQGAIRQIFPQLVPERRWISFVASESPDGNPPGVTAGRGPDGRLLISGTKTWVAAARTVELLLVSVGAGADQVFVGIARDAPGVTIDPGQPPSFLVDLSQGRASFDAVTAGDDAVLGGPGAAAGFGIAEPLHVIAALNAFMLSHAWHWEGAEPIADGALGLLAAAEGLASNGWSGRTAALALAGLDEATQSLAGRFESAAASNNSGLAERWRQDSKLTSFYGRGISLRAAAVRAQQAQRL